MDHFDNKRKMVHQLLSMLKNHAVNEVDSGLKKPEGADDMHGLQVEKVEVLPNHEMDRATPEHEIDTKMIDEGKATSNESMNQGGMAGYNKGGVVDDVNAEKYSREGNTEIPYESADGQPDTHGAVEKETAMPSDEKADEEDASPLFASFFGKKRKK